MGAATSVRDLEQRLEVERADQLEPFVAVQCHGDAGGWRVARRSGGAYVVDSIRYQTRTDAIREANSRLIGWRDGSAGVAS